MNIKVKEISWHRNGVAGTGFYVVLFDWYDEDIDLTRHMVANVFPEAGCLAVLDRDMTAMGEIRFGRGNSWRGDDFEPELRRAIEEKENPPAKTKVVCIR